MSNQNAYRDENGVPTSLGTLTTDGISTIKIAVNPVNRALKVSDGTSGSFPTLSIAPRDDNGVHVWMGVSSADFKTLVPIATNSNGEVLIQST